MRIQAKQKLRLDRESLRRLGHTQLSRVVGGQWATSDLPTFVPPYDNTKPYDDGTYQTPCPSAQCGGGGHM
jgi:hypothetical protein